MNFGDYGPTHFSHSVPGAPDIWCERPLTIYGAYSFDQQAYAGSWFTKAFHSVSNAVSDVATTVAHPVTQLAEQAAHVVAVPLHVAQQGLNAITHNPVWDAAQGAVSFVPIIGQAVSSGMALAAQLGKGGSALDFALAAAKGALPGQPYSGYAFDVAVGLLLHGSRLDSQALALARSQVPGGDLGKSAFDLAVSIILGKHASVRDVAVKAAGAILGPHVDALQHAAFQAGAGIGKTINVAPEVLKRVVASIPPSARAAFDTGLVAAKAAHITPQNLAAFKSKLAPLGPKGVAMAQSVHSAMSAHVAKSQRDVAKVALLAAMTSVRAAGHPHTRAQIQALHARAVHGDKAAATALAVLSIASKAVRAHGLPPHHHAARPGAHHAGFFWPAGSGPHPLDQTGNRIKALWELGESVWEHR